MARIFPFFAHLAESAVALRERHVGIRPVQKVQINRLALQRPQACFKVRSQSGGPGNVLPFHRSCSEVAALGRDHHGAPVLAGGQYIADETLVVCFLVDGRVDASSVDEVHSAVDRRVDRRYRRCPAQVRSKRRRRSSEGDRPDTASSHLSHPRIAMTIQSVCSVHYARPFPGFASAPVTELRQCNGSPERLRINLRRHRGETVVTAPDRPGDSAPVSAQPGRVDVHATFPRQGGVVPPGPPTATPVTLSRNRRAGHQETVTTDDSRSGSADSPGPTARARRRQVSSTARAGPQ